MEEYRGRDGPSRVWGHGMRTVPATSDQHPDRCLAKGVTKPQSESHCLTTANPYNLSEGAVCEGAPSRRRRAGCALPATSTSR